MQSKKFTLNKEDGQAILRGALVAVAGALVTYLMELLPNVNFGEYTPLVVSVLSIALNAGRKWIQGK